MPDKKKEKPLGVVARSDDLVFARTFRFTATSDKNDQLVHFVTKAQVNLKMKVLTLAILETVYYDSQYKEDGNPAVGYVTSMLNDETDNFTLTTYDGMGHAIGDQRFLNAKLIDHDAYYDYASSDVVTHTLTFSYEEARIRHLAHLPSDPIPMGAIPKHTHVEKTK